MTRLLSIKFTLTVGLRKLPPSSAIKKQFPASKIGNRADFFKVNPLGEIFLKKLSHVCHPRENGDPEKTKNYLFSNFFMDSLLRGNDSGGACFCTQIIRRKYLFYA